MYPNFSEEHSLWEKGIDLVIGVDEVGRGCFAGPVVAGAVAFLKDHTSINSVINDSKKVKYRTRKLSEQWIKSNCLWGLGEVSVPDINKVGIGKASFIAMRKAVASILNQAHATNPFVLVDAFTISNLARVGKKNQKGIVKGDEKCFSIAAASIIAKVYRDSYMESLARQCKEYGWGRNKGYGTKEHQAAIKQFGTTKHHRNAFVTTFLSKSPLSQTQ